MRKQLVKCFKDACNALTDARLEALEKEKELSLDECEEIMADHLIANGVTVQQWISVKERLPEAYKLVLAYRATGCEVENCVDVQRGFWANDHLCDYPVTHWMPLPEPPKGE